MNDAPSQRVGPLAALPGLLDELGVDVPLAFDGSGIEPSQLVPDARFPYPMLAALLERSARVARCPHLGLLVGARNDHRALGPIGDMMASAATLGEAFRDYVGVQIGYSRGAVVYLQTAGDDTLIGYGLYAELASGRQIHDLVMALGCNMVRSLTGGRASPLRALASVGPPGNLAPYRSTMKTTALFEQEHTGVVVSARDMALALPGANPARHLQLRTGIQKMLRGDLEDIAAQVRHILRPRLMTGEADRDSVARELGLGGRTLARHLNRAGTNFEAIKDEVRFAIARELLALTRLPIGRIAEALSYSANSTFDHAFTRWAGMAPSQWRAARQADD
ncbi:AraC family transcriptional regulator [Ancylobacter sp. A5.8]|uniref:AraC family transcriptional regulator n=1 Tax=Ancylobacter gelatini TaxID=2919920 RepID=UPI001F4DE0DE|nr:AraC family transcriptional regulator [Ancylobacter gelatini]MCJ8143191.1 AraC family transcriptional regulator [Ancylobacter gelatini]